MSKICFWNSKWVWYYLNDRKQWHKVTQRPIKTRELVYSLVYDFRWLIFFLNGWNECMYYDFFQHVVTQGTNHKG